MSAPQGPPQPDSQFVIATLQEELAAANQNRVYLISLLKQIQQEYRDAQALWQLERDSLIAGRAEDAGPSGS